ncbi:MULTISPECIES: DNA polymerase III subunit epsilon [Sphingobium]|jgi:DNA polymerase-3 subunit epsilon|uniref:DNA polymerase III subunit epsilon n=2 Tax=Sphingobium yanoikuyae TaxID=13690 RepID=K9D6J3_SPHYA|nr:MULTISPECIES: DNA polymerase III subunit epsilon [Sphingobium]RSU76227.1 DNA polymerase III subunit epsilon [Sphingomonas sp. S-NIH.Pt3_0716]ATI82264.1 DNA polymerase III subunit epsilon [Sphingobium yanoikuyae]ATP17656.1 DNA polymerase III subunit epsilon [Sphingobium yanoikuyae]AYO79305.1 DNA polymerase III subunit epsilon [Sphingobium yanoikuyae]EKU74562.1 DNA polymerase III, epsilon subunit [Sphingobium yanoikuyae ATCC 51230]
MREIIFDTETTGFDPASGDRLVEIGCIELINRVPTGRTFHAYYNPQRDMPSAAEAVHGLSSQFLSDKPLFREGVAELMDFLEDSPLVAHNARFDFGFLNHELKLCARDAVSMDRMIDTVAIARTLHPGAKHSLDALCTRYGIDRSHRVKHGALLDAELLAQLYVELTGGRQIGLGLAQEEEKEIVRVELTETAVVRPVRPARVFTASAEELERHAAFVAKLDKPLWLEEAPPA